MLNQHLFKHLLILSAIVFADPLLQASSKIDRTNSAFQYEFNLPYNNFDTYSLEKWKGASIEHGVFKVSAESAARFRGERGLQIKGTLPKGQKFSLLLPLNPNDLNHPGLEKIPEHESQLLVRSNHNGALRYLFMDAEGSVFISPYVLYTAQDAEDVNSHNTGGAIDREWLKSWQLVSFPLTSQPGKYEKYSGNNAKPNGLLHPYALELTVMGIESEIEIHLDEFELALGCMLKNNQEQLRLIPAYSAWPDLDSTLRAFTFSPFEKWTAKSLENTVEVPVKCSAGSQGIAISTNFPEQPKVKGSTSAKIASILITPTGITSKLNVNGAGVKGLRLYFSTTGIPNTKLLLAYNDDQVKWRKDNQQKDVKFSESFCAEIPLDIKGSHIIDLPLSRAGFPAWRNSSFADDMISGNLIFNCFRLVNDSSKNIDFTTEYKVVLQRMELWVEPQLWLANHPTLKWIKDLNQKKKTSTDLMSERCYGLQIMPMDTLELLVEKGKSTFTEPTLALNPDVAVMGENGLSISMPIVMPEPEKGKPPVKINPKDIKEMTADFIVKTGYKMSAAPQGLRDHEAGLYLNSDTHGSIQYMLKDAKNHVIFSKPITFKPARTNHKKNITEEDKIKAATWIEFPTVTAKSNMYGDYEGDRFKPLSSIDFPLVPQGFRISIPNPKETAHLSLDEFQIWSGCMMKSTRNQYSTMPAYAVARKGDSESIRVFDFESDQPWNLDNTGYPPMGKNPEEQAKINLKLKEDLEKSKLAYEEAKKKMDIEQLKDLKKVLSLNSFYRPTAIAPYPPAEVTSLRLAAGEFGVTVNWPQRNEPSPWERRDHNLLRLKNNGIWSTKSPYIMPVPDGVDGIAFTLENTAFPSSSLYIAFIDARGNQWRKEIDLQESGTWDYMIPFDNTGFTFYQYNKSEVTDGIRPYEFVTLAEFKIQNRAEVKNHCGEQTIKMRDFKFIISNSALKNLPNIKSLQDLE